MNRTELLALDRRHVWHPCTQEKDHELLPPIPIVRGEGVRLIDMDGNSYIDGVSSWWVNLFGHNHPRLIRALQQQAQKISHHIFAGFTHEPGVELASRLSALAPAGLEKVFYTDNGSSAVEAALKMSFQFWQQSGRTEKTRFVSLTEAYHGETVGALSVSGCELYRSVYRPILTEGFAVQGPDCYRCPWGQERTGCATECFCAMEQAVAEHHRQIAAVIIEPLVQGAAGMRIYPPDYLRKLRALCDAYEIHYIADEIAVGFGRTGRFFANDHAAVAPDLLCLSKGITGGTMPLAAVLATQRIYDAFYADYASLKAFLHSHSYSGNPLACAVAVETLNIFSEEQVLENLPERMAMLDCYGKELAELAQVGEFRRCGLIGAIELVADKATREPYPWQQRRGYQVYQQALRRGALLRPLGNVIYFMPALTIPLADLAALLAIAQESIVEVTR